MLKHDSPLGGASCGSVNVSSNNTLKFKNNKKTPLQIKLPDLFSDIGKYNIIDIISYHYITFSRILIFLYHFLKGDIFVI
jgi:hypothetical protein